MKNAVGPYIVVAFADETTPCRPPAVDDQLRHPDDQPSIGIILCKGRNEVIVEYALRDNSKPMGVAGYRLSPALPEKLKRDLPTAEGARRAPHSRQQVI